VAAGLAVLAENLEFRQDTGTEKTVRNLQNLDTRQ